LYQPSIFLAARLLASVLSQASGFMICAVAGALKMKVAVADRARSRTEFRSIE
jgi:hypothetical protein